MDYTNKVAKLKKNMSEVYDKYRVVIWAAALVGGLTYLGYRLIKKE